MDTYNKAVDRLNSTIRPHKLQGYMSDNSNMSGASKKTGDDRQFYLDRTAYLLNALGNPEKSGFNVVHVAGTSGKGSTSMMIYEALVAEGVSVGMFNSPYVTTALENVHVNGQLADPNVFVEAVNRVVDVAQQIDKKKPEMMPSYSEIFFAVSLEVFNACGVDWIIAETGCGGRFDYTNAFPDSAVKAAVLTPIAIDHVVVLGDTIEKIAWHKAGIIRKGVPTVSALQHPDATAVIDAEAEEAGSEVIYVAPMQEFNPAMPGAHQQQNAAVAAATCAVLGVSDAAIKEGIETAQLPARIETVQKASADQPMVIIDGAHSEAKIEALVSTIEEIKKAHGIERTHLLFSAKDGKDVEKAIELLAPLTDSAITTGWQLQGFGSVDPEKAAQLFQKYSIDTAAESEGPEKATAEPDFDIALTQILEKAGPRDLVLITGSLYGAGFARNRWITEETILKKRTVFAKSSERI